METIVYASLLTFFSLPLVVITNKLKTGLNFEVKKHSGELILFKGLGVCVENAYESICTLKFVSNRPFQITIRKTLYPAVKQDGANYKYILELKTKDRFCYHRIFCKYGSCRLVYNQDLLKLTRIFSTKLEETLSVGSVFLPITFMLVYWLIRLF